MEQPQAATDSYVIGALVEVRARQEWGPGKIVDVVGDKLHIVFRDREAKNPTVLQRDAPALRLAAVQSDAVLDNLPPLVGGPNGLQLPTVRLPLEQAKRKFLRHFPGGFSDESYLSREREYRLAANRKFRELLDLKEVEKLLSDGHTGLVIGWASSIFSSVGLASAFESAAFHDAMQDEDAAHNFHLAFFRLLEAPEVNREVFEYYIDAVMALPAKRGRVATWPVATLLLYIAQPERFLFLKPEVTKSAAETLGFDLHYASNLNWTTYSALLRMDGLYLDLLRPMGARDLIDVQTFIFVIGGGYD